MRIHILIILLVALFPIVLLADLPTCYHTYDQVAAEMFALEQAHPDIAKVHIIGHSQLDNVPIYAMQISADVNAEWERPALLFIGQVHAEEVLGVEITLSNIHEILQNREQMPYSMWIAQLDSWWIPTLNPEGHNVVTSNIDTSWRKNKRDNNNNGILDFSPLVGYDIDGVDINRNLDFNFAHGDTLMQPGGTEVYDYYRGPAPMSESEIIAFKQLADEKRFVYSIVWHSSRSGNFAEKVYYPFNWKEIRPSPDVAFAQLIGQSVANQILKESGTAPYECYPNLSRRGATHDWMYKEYGTIQLLIEVGTRNLQPDSLLMVDTVERATNGVWWMMNRALMFSTSVPSSSLLTGHTTDSSTQEPIQAEIIIQERHAPWFVPRTSKPETGRFFKPLPTGSYTVQARKKGYWDTILNGVTVYNSTWTTIQLGLAPKDPAVMYGSVNSNGTPVAARILIKDFQPDTLFVNGEYVYHGYEGEYPIEITAEGYYPYLGTINLSPGQNSHHYNLSPITTLLSENWENGTTNWEIQGPWLVQPHLSASGNAITDSWGGRGHYEMNCDVWIKTINPISLPAASEPLLIFDSHLYTEWDHDPVTVEVSSDGTTWTEAWIKSGRHDWWTKEFVNLSAYAGQTVYLRFRLRDSSTAAELTDPGWTIDNILLVTGTATSADDDVAGPQFTSALYPNYPNPFNPDTNIRYSLAKSEVVNLEVYNLKGQRIRLLETGAKDAGNHAVKWDGRDDNGNAVASGIYLYRLQAGNFQKSHKMILMK